MKNLNRKLLSSMSALVLLPIGATYAQSNEDTVDDILIVTATKRGEQNILETPITVQALSGENLKKIGASEFSDYAAFVPSLQFQDLGPGDKEYIIRGVNSGGAATVGVYYDEAIITAASEIDGGGRAADIRLYDLERVEVLKGPQGTLYGANSMSGTIRYITNKPDASNFDANIQAEVSQTEHGSGNYHVNGMVNIPLVEDMLAVRAVGWYVDNSGFIDAVRIPSGPLKNVNNDETLGARFIAKLTPTDDFSITASFTHQETESDGSSRYTPEGSLSFGDAGSGIPPIPGGDLINTDLTQNRWDEDLQVYSLVAEYETEIGTFTGTTNYFDRDIFFAFDSTPILLVFGVPVPSVTMQPQNRSIWSNELRYASDFDGPFNFVVGGFYQKEEQFFDAQVVIVDADGLPIGEFSRLNEDDALLGADGIPFNGDEGNTFFGLINDRSLDQFAFFGEATYDVSDRLSLTFGLRYFDGESTVMEESTHPFGGFVGAPPPITSSSASESKTTLKGNVAYQATDDVLVYFTASEGFRLGGTNISAISPTVMLPGTFTSDSLWNYELGLKASLFDNRATFSGAVYSIRWSDIQVDGIDNTGAFPFIANAGKARINGVEFDLNAEAAPGLTFSLAGSYQDAKLTEDSPFASTTGSFGFDPNAGLDGDRLPNVPKFQGSFSVDYTQPLSDSIDGFGRIDVLYRGDTANQLRPTSPFYVPLEDYTLVNLRVGVSSDHWSLSVFGRNLTDERAQIDAISSTQDPLARITNRPRTIGVSLSANL